MANNEEGQMKRRLTRLIVFAGVVGLVMVVNVGMASADHGANAAPFAEADAIADGTGPTSGVAAATTPGSIPVGTALGFVPGLPPEEQDHPGLQHSQGFVPNLSRNPNCPLHYQF
jgi:2-keto-3-deoxy-galactonokinase